jgi:hypothetical protein
MNFESNKGEFEPRGHEFDPTKLVEFNSFEIGEHDITQISGVEGKAILPQLAEIFGADPESGEWTVEELGKLISVIGQAKTLQDNIPAVSEVLPGRSGKELAIAWVKATGLLQPTFRNFENPDEQLPQNFDSAVVTGGVRNWMMRRANVLIAQTVDQTRVGEVVLVAGTRPMASGEGTDVVEGDTEATYMERVIQPLLEEAGLTVRLVTPDTSVGDEIAQVVAGEVAESESVLVVCNAGNWIQNGGQIRRAIGGSDNKVFVVSDGFPVAENDEKPAVAQNPLTAIGIIARNLQELQRHR